MKSAIVTGASGGLGMVYSSLLLGHGYRVFGLDIREPGLKDQGLVFIKTDISDNSELDKAKEIIMGYEDGLDVIVNNAGIQRLDSLVEVDPSFIQKIINVNLLGAMLVNRCFSELLIKRKGRIIITTSEIGYHAPQPFHGLYSITKRALDSYADSLRRELNCIGIPVIKIQPGGLRTGIIQDSVNSYDAILNSTRYYKAPLTRMRPFVMSNLKKTVEPIKMKRTLEKALFSSHPKGRYRYNNLFILKVLDLLGEKGVDLAFSIFLGKGKVD